MCEDVVADVAVVVLDAVLLRRLLVHGGTADVPPPLPEIDRVKRKREGGKRNKEKNASTHHDAPRRNRGEAEQGIKQGIPKK